MGGPVITLALRSQEDVLLTRRRARDLAGFLQLGAEAQSRLATAVWEVARLALRHGSKGQVELALQDDPPAAVVTIRGIAEGVLMGESPGEALDRLDLAKLRQLVDRVEARDAGGAVLVRLTSKLERDAWLSGLEELSHVMGSLQRHESGEDEAALNELRMQNAELVTALATLSERERELVGLNRELVDTNRAVTALLAELGQQAQELRERAAGHATFLSALTHELRTPLYAVRGMTEAILRDHESDLSEGIRQDVTLIDGAMVEALDLVNDHLDLAKLEAGRTIVRLSDVDVSELFATLRAVVTRLPAHPGVELRFDDADQVPVVRTDGFKLSQILRNFIVNALKFTEAGHVRVCAHAAPEGEAVHFEVSDTGPGLSAEDQRRAFEEFVQLSAERHGELRGTGLGLPLTRRLAAILGGEVSVQSTLGRGATFTVQVPRRHPRDVDGVDVVEPT
jgi:signal transduction histidine kinase